ncbi:hypothetical protein Pmani_003746 [Petrolisthes manimaculis]|uniref:Uncharacterized protein n=1 Tax=Petrolisthes manimaculis TaxID=1843537 RepID=A0AAE1UI43_9EUCA|nr:hypothetical protein Pmani_003746 [Petrolisthes manimaculis]
MFRNREQESDLYASSDKGILSFTPSQCDLFPSSDKGILSRITETLIIRSFTLIITNRQNQAIQNVYLVQLLLLLPINQDVAF